MSWLKSLFGVGDNVPTVAPKGRNVPSSAYMRGHNSGLFSSWNPILRDPKEDVRAAYWQSAARTIDMLHNSGWLSGVVTKSVGNIIGTGLRLNSKPDYEALGWDAKAANDWARMIERRWELWSNTPLEVDAAGKHDIHQLCASALRSWYAMGEYVAWTRWIERSSSQTATKIQLIPANRLIQDSDDTQGVYQGVRVDKTGLPVAYRFNFGPNLKQLAAFTEIAARDKENRPIITHAFGGDIGQMRGISVFAPVLQVLRQYDQLANATLSSALNQAIIAATIESPSPTQDVLQAFQDPNEQGLGGDLDCYMDARAGWYENTNFDLNGQSKIVHLFAGEKLDFKRSETPNSNYEPFVRWLLREISGAGGFTFEDMTGDYTGATYSSIKMATNTNWPIQLWRRQHIAAPLYQSAYDAWLEEELESGRVSIPGGLDTFYANRAAILRCDWRGPSKPIPDEVKFANANSTLYGMGVISAEYIASEMGYDIEDIYDQLQREKEMREERGLPDPQVITPAPDPIEVAEATAGIREQVSEEKAAEKEEAPKPKRKRAASVKKAIPDA